LRRVRPTERDLRIFLYADDGGDDEIDWLYERCITLPGRKKKSSSYCNCLFAIAFFYASAYYGQKNTERLERSNDQRQMLVSSSLVTLSCCCNLDDSWRWYSHRHWACKRLHNQLFCRPSAAPCL